MLHVINQVVKGGDSLFCDGVLVAKKLKKYQ